jgi:hypothetical protein
MGSASIAHLLFFSAIIWTLPLWFITKRIGRAPALSLLTRLPGVGFFWVAFSHWPSSDGHIAPDVDRHLDEAKQQAAEKLQRF